MSLKPIFQIIQNKRLSSGVRRKTFVFANYEALRDLLQGHFHSQWVLCCGLFCSFDVYQIGCQANLYGPGCTQACNCGHGKCDPVSGQCSCDPGYAVSGKYSPSLFHIHLLSPMKLLLDLTWFGYIRHDEVAKNVFSLSTSRICKFGTRHHHAILFARYGVNNYCSCVHPLSLLRGYSALYNVV